MLTSMGVGGVFNLERLQSSAEMNKIIKELFRPIDAFCPYFAL